MPFKRENTLSYRRLVIIFLLMHQKYCSSSTVGFSLAKLDSFDLARTGKCPPLVEKYIIEGGRFDTDVNECDAIQDFYSSANCTVSDSNDETDNKACCAIVFSYYSSQCSRERRSSDINMLISAAVLVLCSLTKSIINRWKIRWITEVGGCILVGGLFGMSRHMLGAQDIVFDDSLFLYILLPPICFNAALSINKPALKKFITPIICYALFGTIFNALLTGAFVYGIMLFFDYQYISILDSFVFGAIISSIDPVVTLSILQTIGVNEEELLYVVIFGESLLNDGVAIVLFKTIIKYYDVSNSISINSSAVLQPILQFTYIYLGSFMIGLITSFLCLLFFRVAYRENVTPMVEVGTFFFWSLIPYYISEILDLSGIVAIVAAGFVMDVFVIGEIRAGSNSVDPLDWSHVVSSQQELSTNGQLSQEANHHVRFVTEVIASMAELAMFAYIGLMFGQTISTHWFLRLDAIVSTIFARAIMILIISFFINLYSCRRDEENVSSKKQLIDKKVQLVMFMSGLRGAVSLALVEAVPVYDKVTMKGSLHKEELRDMTAGMINFSIFVFGACLCGFLEKLGFVEQKSRQHSDLTETLL